MHRAMLICLLPPGSVVMSMARISTEVFETILCWASHTLHWPWDAVTGPVTLAGYCSRRDDPTHLGRAHSLIGKDGPTPHQLCTSLGQNTRADSVVTDMGKQKMPSPFAL